ncbi:type VI secretion protein ImpB [Botrimarina sp.]|uniref:Y-family DNA polymerase n=1 Tax=Botrimarina sp. TaxID=2795802 RepID=UPI0032EB0F77
MAEVDWLFLDMNAFFASAEQQLRPELRGRPVAVVPAMTDRTSCIAASYEARAYGVRTGTNVGAARRQCPGLVLVKGRHERYVEMHHRIVATVDSVLPVTKICSIDEMACRLATPDRNATSASSVARRVKTAIANQVGEHLRSSIGLAPNRLLAKLASNLHKPDGLSIITREELPHRLHRLKLRDFTGIGPNLEKRLASRGVRTTGALCALSKDAMIEVWGSRVGGLWWHWLRGEEADERATQRRTIGHSKVLAPPDRTEATSRATLVRLIHKAAARLRKAELVARRIEFGVNHLGGGKWRGRACLAACDDTPTMLKAFESAWRLRGPDDRTAVPLKVSVTLWKLEPARRRSLPLFAEDRQAASAARAMDAVNNRFGTGSMYFASMHDARAAAPPRIAFQHIPELEPQRAPPQRQ